MTFRSHLVQAEYGDGTRLEFFWSRRDDQPHVNLLSYPNYVNANAETINSPQKRPKMTPKQQQAVVSSTRISAQNWLWIFSSWCDGFPKSRPRIPTCQSRASLIDSLLMQIDFTFQLIFFRCSPSFEVLLSNRSILCGWISREQSKSQLNYVSKTCFPLEKSSQTIQRGAKWCTQCGHGRWPCGHMTRISRHLFNVISGVVLGNAHVWKGDGIAGIPSIMTEGFALLRSAECRTFVRSVNRNTINEFDAKRNRIQLPDEPGRLILILIPFLQLTKKTKLSNLRPLNVSKPVRRRFLGTSRKSIANTKENKIEICINFASIATPPRISSYGRKMFSIVVQLALCVKKRFCVGAYRRGGLQTSRFCTDSPLFDHTKLKSTSCLLILCLASFYMGTSRSIANGHARESDFHAILTPN